MAGQACWLTIIAAMAWSIAADCELVDGVCFEPLDCVVFVRLLGVVPDWDGERTIVNTFVLDPNAPSIAFEF